MLLHLPPLQAEARLQQDIKATKTVAMAVLTYFICYVPTISFVAWGQNAETSVGSASWVPLVRLFQAPQTQLYTY